MDLHKINDDVTVGSQPSADEIQNLAKTGFKSVINLRVDNEQAEQISPVEEGQLARDQGMEYLHIPVMATQIREGQVDEFRNAVENLPKPIFVHCAKGKRAGAFAMMDCAVRERWSGKQTLSHAKEAGFACDDTDLANFVKEYVDSRRS